MKTRILKNNKKGVVLVAILWFIGVASAEIFGPEILFGNHEKKNPSVEKKQIDDNKKIDNNDTQEKK